MKNTKRFFAMVVIAGTVVGLLTLMPSKNSVSKAIVTPAHAEINGCGAQTLRGAYTYSADGFVTDTPGQPPFTPIAEAGVYIFDGAGGASTANTLSFGGVIIPRTDTATYSVQTNCTGSVSLAHGVTFNFAVSRSGSEIRFVVASPGVSVMGTMTPQ